MAVSPKFVIRKRGTPRLPKGKPSSARGRHRVVPKSSSGTMPASRAASNTHQTPTPPSAGGNIAHRAGEIPDSQVPSAPIITPSAPAALDVHKERTVTVKEAAFRLGKSDDAIRLWLRSGRLKGWQPGGRRCAILVAEASVEEALLCFM